MGQHEGSVLVTGGAGLGIGHAISASVARAGWTVVIGDVDIAAAQALADELSSRGEHAVAMPLDVSDESSVVRAFRSISSSLPPLRGLVNSAGVGLLKPLAHVTVEEWDRLHGVDLRGAFLCSRSAIPLLTASGGGAIINIGSVQALGPHAGYSSYAAAKAGLIGLTRGIAADHGRDGIRCSIIHPGLVDSPQNRAMFAQWGDTEAWIDEYVRTRQMIPRLICSEEIGETATFLLSESARSITAAEIVVDGGSSRMAWDDIEEQNGEPR